MSLNGECLSVHNRTDTFYRLLSVYTDTPVYTRTDFRQVSSIISGVFKNTNSDSNKTSLVVRGVGIYKGIDDVTDAFLLARSEFNGGVFHYINTELSQVTCVTDEIVVVETNDLVEQNKGDQPMQTTNEKTITFASDSDLILNLTSNDVSALMEELSLNLDARDLCDDTLLSCPFPLYPFESLQECYDFMTTLPHTCSSEIGGGLLMGNTVACRTKELFLSRLDPLLHCPRIGSTSEKCLQEDCPLFLPSSEPETYETNAGFPTWLRVIDIISVSLIAVIPLVTFALYRNASRQFARLSSYGSSDNKMTYRSPDNNPRRSSSAGRQLQKQSSTTSSSSTASSIAEYNGGSENSHPAPPTSTSDTLEQETTKNNEQQDLPTIEIRGLELSWASKGRKRAKPPDLLIFKSDLFVLGGCKLTAIRGKSGSGKSTLIKLLSGFRQSHMEIKYDEYLQAPPIGYCSQSPEIWPKQMKVRDILLFSCKLYGSDAQDFETVFERLGILPLFDLCFGVLSGGEQQRVHMASFICRTTPCVIFLDEPLASLDSKSALECLKLLKLLPTHHAYVLVVHQTDSAVEEQFDRTIELDLLTHSLNITGNVNVGGEDEEESGALSDTNSPTDRQENKKEGSFFCGVKATFILWHCQFFGWPIIEAGTALCSVLGAIFYGLLTRNTFQESPIPAEYAVRVGPYVAFIIMAAAIITSFCYSLLFAPRESLLVRNLVAQKALTASAYTIATLLRALFYGFFQSFIWFFLVLFVMDLWDPAAALDLTFNVTYFLAGWSALTFTIVYVTSFMAAHFVMILICFGLFLSVLVTPWAAIPDYLRVLHYPNPSFTTIEACKNYFLATTMDSGCGELDHFTVCASSERLVDLIDVQPIYSPVAQAYSVAIITLSSLVLWLYLKPKQWRLFRLEQCKRSG